jgi:hypothetical protein
MCGRIFQTLSLNELMRIANAAHVKNSGKYSGNYNMCPTHYLPAIRRYTRLRGQESSQSQQAAGETELNRRSNNSGDEE